MIQVRGLLKAFGSHTVLRDLNLDVPEGMRLAVVGPNGAGKTTLFRVLATLTKPTAGEIAIDGMDLVRDAKAIRRQIGYISHQPLLYDYLSGEENLRFYGRMYDVPDLDARINERLHHVGMSARRHDLVRTYSRGMRQRLAIARALLPGPRLLLLDEPYTGLDQQAAEMLDDLLEENHDGRRTILLTTHHLGHGLRFGDAIAILNKGRIVQRMDRDNWDPDRFRLLYREQLAKGVR
jgi:heme exporter protein A